jgi:hypothetical protein
MVYLGAWKKLITSINDIGGKIITGVVDTGSKQ